jgi:hypothetical protein
MDNAKFDMPLLLHCLFIDKSTVSTSEYSAFVQINIFCGGEVDQLYQLPLMVPDYIIG